jgi:hypothetical protein
MGIVDLLGTSSSIRQSPPQTQLDRPGGRVEQARVVGTGITMKHDRLLFTGVRMVMRLAPNVAPVEAMRGGSAPARHAS